MQVVTTVYFGLTLNNAANVILSLIALQQLFL